MFTVFSFKSKIRMIQISAFWPIWTVGCRSPTSNLGGLFPLLPLLVILWPTPPVPTSVSLEVVRPAQRWSAMLSGVYSGSLFKYWLCPAPLVTLGMWSARVHFFFATTAVTIGPITNPSVTFLISQGDSEHCPLYAPLRDSEFLRGQKFACVGVIVSIP